MSGQATLLANIYHRNLPMVSAAEFGCVNPRANPMFPLLNTNP